MTTQPNQAQPTQSQSNDEQAEKLRRVLSVKDPAAAQPRDNASVQPAKPATR
ncbi:MAG: hypothetical protein ABUL62_23405 [Myxococcales bacterium]